MNKPHAGFWLAMLELGMSWLLVLLTHDKFNGVLLAGSVLALFFTPAARRIRCTIDRDEQHRNGWPMEL